MAMLPVYALPIFLTFGTSPAPIESNHPGLPSPGGSLSAEDARYLDWLVEDFLFDPKRARYVRVSTSEDWQFRTGNRHGREALVEVGYRDGWLVRGSVPMSDRVFFADGESMSVVGHKVRQLDFEDLCLRRFLGPETPVRADLFGALREPDRLEEYDLVAAAWLHRRGQDRLAAIALAATRYERRDDPREVLLSHIGIHAYEALVDAFCNRQDADAIAHADRLSRLYPDVEWFPQAEAVANDLRRRQQAGTAARKLPKDWPSGFATWTGAKKVEYLVDLLDDIEQWNEFARVFRSMIVNMGSDDRLTTALVELGDAAIPALIDAYERDDRLIRCRHDEGVVCGNRLRERVPQRVAEVREVLIDVIGSILRVHDWDPTGVDEKPEDRSPAALAGRLRRYWATYGQLPFDDRMMAILTDRAVRPDARQDAATHLVAANKHEDQSWARSDRGPASTRPSSLVTKYRNPSVAEAILAAMDEHQAHLARQTGNRRHWGRPEEYYLDALTDLGDQRIGLELARRSEKASSINARLQLAQAAHALGMSGPMNRLCREVAAGNICMPLAEARTGQPREFDRVSLLEALLALAQTRLPEANDALHALADRDHSLFPLVSQMAMEVGERRHETYLMQCPFFVAVLRSMLTDSRLTGGHYYLRGNEIDEWIGNRTEPRQKPTVPNADLGLWYEHVEQRVADMAMDKLNDLVVGLPEYHPLRRDAAKVVTETRTMLLRFDRRLREANYREQTRFRLSRIERVFIPDIKPLDRPATARDVATGASVFEQKGMGKVASVKMPAWLVLKSNASKEDSPCGLVVQAETGPDGKVTYGVIFRHAIRAVRADEVERIESDTR